MRHAPIMVAECMDALLIAKEGFYLDATFGDGGHTFAILQRTQARVIALDRDAEAVAKGQQRYGNEKRLRIHHLRFSRLEETVAHLGQQVNGVMMDLGVSARQLEVAERGFSFRLEGPLDMRMDQSSGKPLRDLLAKMNGGDLTRILAKFGEEPRARRIAAAIIARRGQIHKTTDLTRTVTAVLPAFRRNRKIHPVTRVFAALRIFVNDELTELSKGLAAAARVLLPGGRLAVLAFHALEHRIIKEFGRANPLMRTINQRKPQPSEVQQNPRARSAILRVMEKSRSC